MRRQGNIMIFSMLMLWLLVMALGCQSGEVIIGKHPPYTYGPPPFEKGPPPWAPAHGYRAKHRYHYYPSDYLYYDTGRRLYFYYGDGRWRVSASLPAGIYIDAEHYVTLEMDTEKPYEFHSEVVKRYPPGQLKKMDEVNDKRKYK